MAPNVFPANAPISVLPTALFATGFIVLTPGVKALARRGYINVRTCLDRHRSGDWGQIDADERFINDHIGLKGREKLFSRYPVSRGIWMEIWTMYDLSMTVLLLPYE
ncbi:hypothetical protein ACVSNE_00265 [Pseudomonas aeruginosa]|uniref:Uncharacterized protein n=1 Tax=Burkholderia cenocepacia TaxID=95486 RepID=A0ABD4UI21_9BURK|nr:hypothetical protein [Burkholderia cenocepacia]MCW3660304.1 hypothetical protein [Burkholderia cenocepacia]MCW3697961.1 hypothetical protein [Burkholderia cenocepacia]MCW3705682.1 hypothetical protein [Burkholderia cenocepacia]MCW3713987.1 hypothetical protein [Burkholderia cenocepacia]MCW3722121.1 hypothetical protein [Burkholderia cenocepacia]